MSAEELLMIKGGAGITSTFLNAVSRLVSTVYGVGQSVGSSIRRIVSGKICKIS